MKKPITLNAILFVACLGSFTLINAQSKPNGYKEEIKLRLAKPYKVLSKGREITIQSKQTIRNISNIMVWTVSGHRIVEAKNIYQSSFSFTIFVKEKIFFVMVEFADGKRFTEKIGIQ